MVTVFNGRMSCVLKRYLISQMQVPRSEADMVA